MTYEFTLEESQIILNALSDQPYKTVVSVINRLQKQATEQMQPKQNFGVPVSDSDKAI